MRESGRCALSYAGTLPLGQPGVGSFPMGAPGNTFGINVMTDNSSANTSDVGDLDNMSVDGGGGNKSDAGSIPCKTVPHVLEIAFIHFRKENMEFEFRFVVHFLGRV